MRRQLLRALVPAFIAWAGSTAVLAFDAPPAATGTKRAAAPPPATTRALPEAAAEKAIRQSAEAFAAAYNKGDARSIAAGFTAEAEFVDETGAVISGRDAIARHFALMFSQLPGAKVSVKVESVRVLAPNVAVEEGVVEATAAPEAAPTLSRYVALHLLQEGQWLIARARDFPAERAEPTHHERLQPLAWLIGDWVDEAPDALIHTTCRWSDDGNFLIQTFTARIGSQVARTGSTRFGWDPLTRQIKSWTFGSDGAFSEALWTNDGEVWTSKSRGVTSDGQIASATTVLRQVDASTLSWETRDRIVGGEPAGGIGPFLIKRRAPLPAE